MSTETHTIPEWALNVARRAYADSPIKVFGAMEAGALVRQFAKAIHDAVMAERERCAGIVEAKAIDIYRNDDEGIDAYAIGQIIVSAIRGEGV